MFSHSCTLFHIYYRVCNQINTTGVTSGAGTTYHSEAPEFTPGFQWGSCFSIFSFMCMFCRSLFVHLYFFFWPLCCLLFFDIRILIAHLVSSNSSYDIYLLFVRVYCFTHVLQIALVLSRVHCFTRMTYIVVICSCLCFRWCQCCLMCFIIAFYIICVSHLQLRQQLSHVNCFILYFRQLLLCQELLKMLGNLHLCLKFQSHMDRTMSLQATQKQVTRLFLFIFPFFFF